MSAIPDFIYPETIGQRPPDLEDRLNFQRALDSERKAKTIVSNGDHVISEWTLTATCKEPFLGGGLRIVPICVRGVSGVQIKNGKITQWSDYYDQPSSRRYSVAAWFTEWIEPYRSWPAKLRRIPKDLVESLSLVQTTQRQKQLANTIQPYRKPAKIDRQQKILRRSAQWR